MRENLSAKHLLVSVGRSAGRSTSTFEIADRVRYIFPARAWVDRAKTQGGLVPKLGCHDHGEASGNTALADCKINTVQVGIRMASWAVAKRYDAQTRWRENFLHRIRTESLLGKSCIGQAGFNGSPECS